MLFAIQSSLLGVLGDQKPRGTTYKVSVVVVSSLLCVRGGLGADFVHQVA
jgi:hypothetical protein